MAQAPPRLEQPQHLCKAVRTVSVPRQEIGAGDDMQRMDTRSIWTFLGLFVLLSAVFYVVPLATGKIMSGNRLYLTGLMWSPGLAAILTCWLRGIPMDFLGWRWGEWRWQWRSYLVPFGYALVAYAIVWATGLGVFGNPEFIDPLPETLGWSTGSAAGNVLVFLLLTGTVGMVQSLSRALGEEIGWRGFLAPALTGRMGYTKASLIVGLIWGAWHIPGLVFADYNGGTPPWFAISCFMTMVVASSFIMTWFRLRSGSLWTAAVMHASHNLFIQAFFTPMTGASGEITPYAIDEFGFVLPLVMMALAFWFWLRRDEAVRAAA